MRPLLQKRRIRLNLNSSRSRRGRAFVADILCACEGRYAANVHDKLLALCGWFFEYIYEPVYKDDPWLLYEKNFHRFVAMFSWLWINEVGGDDKLVIAQFQKYMRSLDSADAPYLFNRPMPPLSDDGDEHPFESVLRFSRSFLSAKVRL